MKRIAVKSNGIKLLSDYIGEKAVYLGRRAFIWR